MVRAAVAAVMTLRCPHVAGLLVLLVAGAATAGPVFAVPPSKPPRQPGASPGAAPDKSLERSLRFREEGERLASDAAEARGTKQEKLLARAEDRYRRCIDEAERAAELDPGSHQAFNLLGYCLRKTGKLPQALAAYDRALALSPGYPEAIEYRGEAYLAMGRWADARDAYEQLATAGHAEEAADLLAAIRAWVAAHETDPGDIAPADFEELAGWVAARPPTE